MESGAQPGNQNAVKAKRWQKAIERALARFTRENVDAGLDRAADQLVKLAVEGDKWALDHMADRIDGKAPQTTEVNVDAGTGLLAVLAQFGKRSD